MQLASNTETLFDYDIHYYTKDNVYRYNNAKMQVFSENNWGDINGYNNPEETNITYSGIIMSQFDPLIPDNNINNNLIIGIHLNYKMTQNRTFSLLACANPAIASTAVSNFKKVYPDLPTYYFSHYARLQILSTLDYKTYTDGTNLYALLNSRFTPTNPPYNSFYNGESIINEKQLATLNPTQSANEFYLYINLTYYEDKVKSLIDSITPIQTITSMYFFQDIFFMIREGI